MEKRKRQQRPRAVSRAVSAFALPLEGGRLLLRERRLWSLALVSMLLSLAAFAAAITFIVRYAGEIHAGVKKQIQVDQEGLPDGLRRLIGLATAVPERKGARREAVREPLLARESLQAKHGGVEGRGELVGQARRQSSHGPQSIDPGLALAQEGKVALERRHAPRQPRSGDPEDHRTLVRPGGGRAVARESRAGSCLERLHGCR